MLSSGYLIGGMTDPIVLTSAHGIDYHQRLRPDQELSIRTIEGAEFKARPLVVCDNASQVDLALLAVTDERINGEGFFEDLKNLPPVSYARVERDRPDVVTGCWVVGFPGFKQQAEPVLPGGRRRDTAQANGTISPGADQVRNWLTLDVKETPNGLHGGGSEWEGMSGSVVFAPDGDSPRAVGVVVEHYKPQGVSALTVVPIMALCALDNAAEWCDHFGVTTLSDLPRVPRPANPMVFRPLRPGATRFPDLEDYVADQLADFISLRTVAKYVGCPPMGDEEPDDDRRRKVVARTIASRMYSGDTDLNRVATALSRAPAIGRARADIADRLVPFKETVPDGAAARLASLVKGGCMVAADGERAPAVMIRADEVPFAFWHFVRAREEALLPRAIHVSDERPPDSPVSVSDFVGDQIRARILAEAGWLGSSTSDGSDQDLDDALDSFADDDRGPIVVIWPAGFDISHVTELRARYPRLLFAIVVGADETGPDDAPLLEVLQNPRAEHHFYRQYRTMTGGVPPRIGAWQ
ncbi:MULTISPECIES: trypsin-like peptidase domain-containing protein [unclassified Frankia]|uniref:trypsin-like peptidase domain-containing protein n=1 Tax=unclassified Frankia TaxID=2632575 RepID=UPI002AD3FC77|nr:MULTISPECIES: trypsin-like peptidase domain-containing protein [unclassified Frankia]